MTSTNNTNAQPHTDSTATGPVEKEIVHLSETGFNAGRRLCLSPEGRSVHAAYAPLANLNFRASCCMDCLRIWANHAYEAGDEMPDFIRELRTATIADNSSTT